MSKLPLVTVITPSYNQGRFIEDTIKSVLSQDYPRIEYIVIDGGSRDNTLEILRKHEDSLSWLSGPDNGQTDAINKGFRMAKGEIVCWLNSDDTYEPGAIKKAVDVFISDPDVMMVYGEGNEISEEGTFLHRFPATQDFDLWVLTYIHDYILQPTTFFRKIIFDEIDFPDESLNWCMDWDLWIRIGIRFKVAYVNYVFANSRIYSDTKTASGGIRRLKEIISVMRKYGSRKFPLGTFLYGVDTLETICRTNYYFLFLCLSPLFNRARKILASIQYQYQGVYTDRWLGKTANFMLPLSHNSSTTFQLEAPTSIAPSSIDVIVDNYVNSSYRINVSSIIEIEVKHPSTSRKPIEVRFKFNRTFRPQNDPRYLSCRLLGKKTK
jgi:glycosyltransferase involved in cell wall biosynthesis